MDVDLQISFLENMCNRMCDETNISGSTDIYNIMSLTLKGRTNILEPTPYDMEMMLACEVHKGTKNLEKKMQKYVHTRRSTDGVHIINLRKTWEKLVLAARAIVTIENAADVVAISSRQYGARAVLKFAHYTGAHYIANRFTPGTFTNQIQDKFMEPRLLIITDPRSDHQVRRICSSLTPFVMIYTFTKRWML